MADMTGARKAIEWFLGRSQEEPSDTDLVELHRFLRELDRIDTGTELNLPEWEVLSATPEPERRRALN